MSSAMFPPGSILQLQQAGTFRGEHPACRWPGLERSPARAEQGRMDFGLALGLQARELIDRAAGLHLQVHSRRPYGRGEHPFSGFDAARAADAHTEEAVEPGVEFVLPSVEKDPRGGHPAAQQARGADFECKVAGVETRGRNQHPPGAGNVYVGGFSDDSAGGSYGHYWLVRKGTNGGANWQTVDAFRYFPYPTTFAANGALAMGTDALGNVYAVGCGPDDTRVGT